MASQSKKATTRSEILRLTADLKPELDSDLRKLRGLLLAASSGQLDEAATQAPQRLARLALDDEDAAAAEPFEADEADLEDPPLHILRRDEREDLLAARLAGPLTALGGAERLGPFFVDDRPIFFQYWRAARRFEITEDGAPAPAFVLSSARRPVVSAIGAVTLDLQAGTVWIRGDLLNAGLPAGAYVGATVSDGKLRLPDVTGAGEGSVDIAAPLEARLELALAAEEVAPAEGGCASGVSLQLPVLTLVFRNGGVEIEGGKGGAGIWGQEFVFSETTGASSFVPQLWTLLLEYKVQPDRFDAAQIVSKLCEFEGKADVAGAALALPVVSAAPAALGPAAVSPGFWLALKGVRARWYAGDARFHSLDPWMALNNRAVALLDLDAAPLAAPVKTAYRLWELPPAGQQPAGQQTGGQAGERRLPWGHDYVGRFIFYHLCDVKSGETLVATGRARLALDRPVRANGLPVATPAGFGAVLLRASSSGVRATLAAGVEDSDDTRLVLRNALVWATQAAAVFADGALADRERIDDGSLLLQFGVYGWTPALPDPYVGNFHICRPSQDRPRALLGALVRWASPDAPATSFLGDIGPPVVCAHPPSPDDPRAAPKSKLNPDVGLTQSAQGRIYPDEEEIQNVSQALARERKLRAARVREAAKRNQASLSAIEGGLAERLGRTPPLFLLDVSTNQDLLGVALWGVSRQRETLAALAASPAVSGALRFSVAALDVASPAETMRLVALPQVQWEPVRTLDEDQDIFTLGWFPTPLASATDGGPTVLGARTQKLAPAIPEPFLNLAKQEFDQGTNVVFKTTLPFGLVTVVDVNPTAAPGRRADTLEITQPEFAAEAAVGGLQITAKAEGGRDSEGAVSPYFDGATRQLINGIDLQTGAPLGLSVLSSTGDPAGDVETIFNNDMAANPKSPVTRFDLSGYGGSNFSKWENPFALFAETAKTQFQMTVGRTALEIIKVASVLHPWGIRVTRSVIVERRSGGGVIRRDTGWQATSPGLFDYRYLDASASPPAAKVADYAFDAGIFKGLFGVRSIRPALGLEFSSGGATFAPYYFDADLALDGHAGRTPAVGLLGWLQTRPNGDPASRESLRALIKAQGAVGGPIDAWVAFGASKLPFRARRVEIDAVDDAAGDPIFVAAVRGAPKLPKTGAWSVVRRPVAGLAPGEGAATPISDAKGAPVIRRYAVKYQAGDTRSFAEPPRDPGVPAGDWRIADPADLLDRFAPRHEYALLQSAPTHGFLFARPFSANAGAARIDGDVRPELADVLARSTSKGAFPPPENAIPLNAPMHFDVGADGSLTLSDIVTVVNHPTPLRLAGATGHGSDLSYSDATMELELGADRWRAEFNGMTLWSDIAGLERATGARLRIVGSTDQRPQVSEIDTIVYEPIEKILTYLPVFGAREPLGPVDLGAANANHELKIVIETIQEVPREGFDIGGVEIKLLLGAGGSTGFDLATGGVKASGELMAGVKGEFPILSVGVASVFIIVQLDVKFTIVSVVGVVTEEKLELVAFVGIGVKGSIGPFKAYAYLGVGFVFVYDITSGTPKFGGLVRFEAGIDLKVVKVKLLAELKGVVYKKTEALPPPETGTTEKTYCDYAGKVKLQVDIFMIISISATYTVSDTKELE